MFIVGIDIAKHTHQASVMNPDGSLIGKSIKISNTSSDFEAFIEKLGWIYMYSKSLTLNNNAND